MHGDDATTLASRRDFLEDGMAAALAINENPSRCSALTASVPDTMGSLGMRQFKGADGRRLLEGLRERFEIKVCGHLQICKSLFFGVALTGRADFGTLGNEPVCF